jgi:hypothetical protein
VKGMTSLPAVALFTMKLKIKDFNDICMAVWRLFHRGVCSCTMLEPIHPILPSRDI